MSQQWHRKLAIKAFNKTADIKFGRLVSHKKSICPRNELFHISWSESLSFSIVSRSVIFGAADFCCCKKQTASQRIKTSVFKRMTVCPWLSFCSSLLKKGILDSVRYSVREWKRCRSRIDDNNQAVSCTTPAWRCIKKISRSCERRMPCFCDTLRQEVHNKSYTSHTQQRHTRVYSQSLSIVMADVRMSVVRDFKEGEIGKKE